MTAATIALILAALADVYTSFRGFKLGAQEVGLARIFGKRLGLPLMLAIKGAGVWAILHYAADPAYVWAAAAFWMAVAIYNWKQVR